MKKIFLVAISLLTFLITFNSVKALSCYYSDSECMIYNFKYRETSTNSLGMETENFSYSYTLEIGKRISGEYYAFVKDEDNEKGSILTLNGSSYSGKLPDGNTTLGRNFSISAELVKNMPSEIQSTTNYVNPMKPTHIDGILGFTFEEPNSSSYKQVVKGLYVSIEENKGDGSNTSTGNCYFKDDTNVKCKRYFGFTDHNNNSIALEIGHSDEHADYFLISKDNFGSLFGQDGFNIGSRTNGVFAINGDIYAIAAEDADLIYSTFPDNIQINGTSVSSSVYRYTISIEKNNHGGYNSSTGDNVGYTDMDCYGLLGSTSDPNDPAYWLQKALQVIRYAGIVALFVLSTVDFVKAIVNQDNDALKKAINTTVKRFIYAVLIFFIPMLTESILKFFGVYGTCAL